MAKGKGGKSKGNISEGKHSNVSTSTKSAMKKAVGGAERVLRKQRAYLGGKNPWITIPNPNKAETNRQFIKVKAVTLYGSLKERRLGSDSKDKKDKKEKLGSIYSRVNA